MFKFTLEALLNCKQGIKNEKQRETELAHMKLLEAMEIQSNYEKQKNKIITHIHHIQKNNIDPIQISLYQDFLKDLERKIYSQINHINALDHKLKDKQQELISAMQEEKILEKLKEKEKKSWNQKLDYIEQKELDNLSNSKFYEQKNKTKTAQ